MEGVHIYFPKSTCRWCTTSVSLHEDACERMQKDKVEILRFRYPCQTLFQMSDSMSGKILEVEGDGRWKYALNDRPARMSPGQRRCP